MASLRATKHKVRRTLFCCLRIHRCQNVALSSKSEPPLLLAWRRSRLLVYCFNRKRPEFVYSCACGECRERRVARDARRLRWFYSTPLGLQTVRCGYLFCRFRRLFHNWLCAIRPRAAKFRAPDRTALRCLPHRFSRAYPVWSTVQAARIHRRRRRIPHDAILFQHGGRRAGRTRQAARLCKDNGYAGEQR